MFSSSGQTHHTAASCNSFLVLSKPRLSSHLFLLKWCWLVWLYYNLLKRNKTVVFWDGSVRIQTWDFSDPAAPTGEDLFQTQPDSCSSDDKVLILLELFLPTSNSKNVASVIKTKRQGMEGDCLQQQSPKDSSSGGHNLKSSCRWDISAWTTVMVLAAIAIKLLNRHRWQIITLNPDSGGENRSGGVTSTANRHLSSLSAENQHAEPIC